MRYFITGFTFCLAMFVLLTVTKYYLYSTDQTAFVGFPFRFWRRLGDHAVFFADSFILDLAITLLASFAAGRWYQLSQWRKSQV